LFYFVYRMLSLGDTVLPEGGMGALAAQLASALPSRSVRVGARVAEILRDDGGAAGGVRLEGGEAVPAAAVVVATSVEASAGLLGLPLERRSRDVTCLYYATPQAPVTEPILVLDGDGSGPVTNLCVPSRVAAGYAPPGRELVSATVLGTPPGDDAPLDGAVRTQMSDWFGADAVGRWRLLRVYRIPWAQFAQPPSALAPDGHPVAIGRGLFVCGDHVEHGSINGAMRSGRRAAEAVMKGMSGVRSNRDPAPEA
jgi:phytoene dehydrogenase-like protein